MLQLTHLHPKFDALHAIHGSKSLMPVYGGGQIDSPRICLIFMNPTAKNVSSVSSWNGIRAPWIGTKNVWRLLFKMKLFNNAEIIEEILRIRPEEWTVEFAENLYSEIAKESLYITNIAKCTQDDARHIPDSVYKEYLPTMLEELETIQPQFIIALGNQVSSVILQKSVSVAKYVADEFELVKTPNGNELKIYPTYYPIGHGAWNMDKAMKRVELILNSNF